MGLYDNQPGVSKLNDIFDTLKTEMGRYKDYVKGPLETPYFGAEKGFDIADLIDVPERAAHTAYRAAEHPIRRAINTATKASKSIAELSGESIMSQTDADKFFNRYTEDLPDDSTIKERYNLQYSDAESLNPFSGNYFSPVMGINIKEGKKGRGVEPITAAEEIQHGRGYGEDNKIYKKSQMNQGGALSEYIFRLLEEGRAKTSGLKDVLKHEGPVEAAASIPSALSTFASYILPHGAAMYSGKNEKREWADKMISEELPKYGTGMEGFEKYLTEAYGEDMNYKASKDTKYIPEEIFKLGELKEKGGLLDMLRYYMGTRGDRAYKQSKWVGRLK